MKVVVVICLVLLNGCSLWTPAQPAVKASVTSQYASSVQVKVFVEGTDGNAVTGARVVVTNPGGSVASSGYSNSVGGYAVSYAEPLSGDYGIAVYSRLLADGTKAFTVHHLATDKAAAITQLSDSAGNSGLTGQSLNGNQEITISWSSVPNATVYQVAVNNGAVQAWSGTAVDPLVSVPASTLKAGTYTVLVKGQWVSGDPYLVSSDTYSASEGQGASVQFTVQ